MTSQLRFLGATLLALLGASAVITGVITGQDPPRFQVEVKDGAAVAQELLLPIDPQVRISPQHSNNVYFGLTVDGKRITCSPQGSIWPSSMIDGVIQNPSNNGAPIPIRNLPAAAPGKARHGFMGSWAVGPIGFTQTIEVVPSKAVAKIPGAKRKLDTCRISYLIENKDNRPHEIAFRISIDILVNNNDGALYLSPTTEPGKVLNGVVLQGKTLPTFIQVIENPSATDPGFFGVMTLKFGGKMEGPSKIVLSNLGAVGGGAGVWDIAAQPAGDSACALYWDKKVLKAGEKREIVWAYGGGIASDADNDGKVTLALGGNLEPGKLFTLSALVEDPSPNQTLALELPAGVERVEGSEIQPVPLSDIGHGMVMWKGRVTRPGAFDIRVRSNTGVTQTKSILIQPLGNR